MAIFSGCSSHLDGDFYDGDYILNYIDTNNPILKLKVEPLNRNTYFSTFL